MRMFMPRLIAARVLPLVLAFGLLACAGHAHAPLSLTIAHVNDTHSALEPAEENLTLPMTGGSQVFRTKLGGMARLKSALDDVRAHDRNVLVLHAGDAVQGTLYFNVFGGMAEFDFLNALGLNAMTLGNHEFDNGPFNLAHMLSEAQFPILSANLDVSNEPELKGRIWPYILRQFDGERVAVVGVTTPVTPRITRDVGRVRFHDPTPVLAALVRELKAQDINKIIVLSHDGYESDLALARTVPGIDVIVGGHSHTLLGDAKAFGALGLHPAGPYPTQVQGPDGPVLVVQAWKWGEELGVLTVRFDAEGHVAGFTAAPTLLPGERFRRGDTTVDPASPEQTEILARLKASGVAKIYPSDQGMLRKLAPYTARVAAMQNAPIGARAAMDLIRGTATDPGPLVADAYLAKVPDAQIALVGAGGVRRDLFAGELTRGMVMGVAPFGNTLVALDITGAQLKEALEEAVEFRISVRPPQNGDPRLLPVIHPAGFSYVVHPLRPKGQRVDGLLLRRTDGTLAALDPAATYRLVTNSFLAGGGDGMDILKTVVAGRVDTGFFEHDVLAEHLAHLGLVGAPVGPRVVIDVAAPAPDAATTSEHSALVPLLGRPAPRSFAFLSAAA
ncbi:MAG: bifunctional metallophosphatase/5'-nucleotidase [Humidesulfovibrio sp.]|nr:bifunctional metallophosphatase/5'-nucleotidase [Humidesulfovibrio sp.]